MSIPTLNRIVSLDFGNATSFPGSGTTIFDLTTSGNNFQLQNTGYTYSTNFGGVITLPKTTGIFRNASLFDFAYGDDPLSIVIWMQLNETGIADYAGFHFFNDTGGAGSYNTIYFGTTPGNNIFVEFSGGQKNNTTSPLSLNTWYMLAFTKQNNSTTAATEFYLNGSLLSMTGGDSTVVNLASGFPCKFNGNNNGGFWDCVMTIGEISIYADHLNSTKISDYYNATSARYNPPPPPPPSIGSGRQFGEGFNG